MIIMMVITLVMMVTLMSIMMLMFMRRSDDHAHCFVVSLVLVINKVTLTLKNCSGTHHLSLSIVKSDKNDSQCLFLVNFLTLVVSSSLQLSVLRQYTESTLLQVERRTHAIKCGPV